MNRFNIIIVALLFISCNEDSKQNHLVLKTEKTTPLTKNPTYGLIVDSAMAVSARAEASKIGVDIMKLGGNAFDAMIATELALAVTYPVAGNIAGGGFMVYRTQNGAIGALDYREKAPLRATRNMYLDKNGDFISEKSKLGALAVGVPGTVAGIFEVYKILGSWPLDQIFKPVIDLAKKGYVVTSKQASRLNQFKNIIKDVNLEESLYTQNYKEGDTLKNVALANTLIRISKNGRKEFYEGETTKNEEKKQNPGFL